MAPTVSLNPRQEFGRRPPEPAPCRPGVVRCRVIMSADGARARALHLAPPPPCRPARARRPPVLLAQRDLARRPGGRGPGSGRRRPARRRPAGPVRRRRRPPARPPRDLARPPWRRQGPALTPAARPISRSVISRAGQGGAAPVRAAGPTGRRPPPCRPGAPPPAAAAPQLGLCAARPRRNTIVLRPAVRRRPISGFAPGAARPAVIRSYYGPPSAAARPDGRRANGAAAARPPAA